MQRVSSQLSRQLGKKQSVNIFNKVVNVSADFSRLQTILFLFKNVIYLPRRAQEVDADLIIFSSMVTAIIAPLIKYRVSVPMVAICHGRDVVLPNPLYQQIMVKAFDYLEGIIAVSRATEKKCIERGADPYKTTVLPNGVSQDYFGNLLDKNEARNKLHALFDIPKSDQKILLTVGRFVKRKGHEWFIREVMPKLDEKVIYLTIGDGPEAENIKKLAETDLFNDRVFLLGQQPDEILKYAYAAADVFVMPNIPVNGDMEGFGIVLLEANMTRTPVIATDIEGIKDVIAQGQNGYRVSVLDADEFARKLHQVLNNELEQFSEQTRTYVREQFSWQQLTQQYLEYLESLIQRF